MAVDLFILLSGFLMVFHYDLREKQEPWRRPSTWLRFWIRRFFRIAPLYYTLLIVALVAGPAVGHARMELATFLPATATPPARYFDQSLVNIAAHLTFVFGQIPHYAFRTPLPDWSIGLEMAFYAVFPFIMLLSKRISLPLAAILLSGASFALTKAFPGYAAGFQEPSLLTLKLHIFFAGMLIARAHRRDLPEAVVLVLLAVLLSLSPLRSSALSLAIRALLTAGLAFLVIGPRLPSIGLLAARLDAALSLKPFRVLGDLSYGVYLVHLLILIPVAAWTMGLDLGTGAKFVLATCATIVPSYALAFMGFRFVEKPGVRLGKTALATARRKFFPARIATLGASPAASPDKD